MRPDPGMRRRYELKAIKNQTTPNTDSLAPVSYEPHRGACEKPIKEGAAGAGETRKQSGWVFQRLSNLSPVAQFCVSQHTGQHCFGHRHGAYPDARVMAAFGLNIDLFTGACDRFHGR